MQNNIYLIGFMGAGKSYIGRLLSTKLQGYKFIDLDEYILQKSGAVSISAIFESKGESAFRELERAALQETLASAPAVIATGGGCPCFADNMQWMSENGLTIFLDPPLSILYERLCGESDKRPLIAGLEEEELKNFIKKTMEMRRSYYNQAAIDITYTTAKEILAVLLSKIPQNLIK